MISEIERNRLRHSRNNKEWVNSLEPKGKATDAITLASNGKTDYVILLPAAPTSQEGKAAADLALWLKEMTGAEFAIVKDAGSSKFISIGRTSAATAARLSDADLGKEGYEIAVKGDNLLLSGGSIRGPIYAVYALLEEDLGCRWYARDTATIPHMPNLTFRPVPRRFVPVLDLRDPFYWDAFDGTWSLRNRTNAPDAPIPWEWGGHHKPARFVHTFGELLPPDKYFSEHPEYFSENDGKRNHHQICVSNPDVVPIVVERVKSILKDNPHSKLVSVSQNDASPCCACAKCKMIADAEGSLSGPLLLFVNAVADAVAEEFPDVKVSTLAYMDTFLPPRTVRPHPNVIIHLATDRHAWFHPFAAVTETDEFQNAMKGWAAIGANIHIWHYTANVWHYLAPIPNMPLATDDIRFFLDHNAVGIMLQGAWQGFGGADGPMKSWVWAKQLWDPTRDTKSLIRDFIYGYYGDAAEPMQQYQDLLWNIWEENHHGCLAQVALSYPTDLPIFSREFLDNVKALFSRAKELAQVDEEILRRVELAELAITYVELDQSFNRLVKAYDSEEAAGMLAKLKEFEYIAHREDVQYLKEGPPNTDEWIAMLRRTVSLDPDHSRQWNARIEDREASVLRLPARWRFATDRDDMGVTRQWFSETFDDGSWGACRTDLDCGWDKQGFEEVDDTYGWYRQKIKLSDGFSGKHCYLYFGAVDEEAYVYINGEPAFEHSCQSTGLVPAQIWWRSFMFDAHTKLRQGAENTLVVRSYNRMGQAGIWKPVFLVSSDSELDLATAQMAVMQEPGD